MGKPNLSMKPKVDKGERQGVCPKGNKKQEEREKRGMSLFCDSEEKTLKILEIFFYREGIDFHKRHQCFCLGLENS